MSERGDISVVCLWLVELSRAAPAFPRGASQRGKEHWAPANSSGLEDVLGQGSDVPTDGASSLSTTAQCSGSGAPSERVGVESVDRLRLNCAPHLKYKFLLPNAAHSMGRALEYFRRVAKQTDSASARAAAAEREFICDSI